MAKTPFNIQDQYLNQARKERVRVTVMMMSGQKLEGYIKSFDSFCVLVESSGDHLNGRHVPSAWEQGLTRTSGSRGPLSIRGPCREVAASVQGLLRLFFQCDRGVR